MFASRCYRRVKGILQRDQKNLYPEKTTPSVPNSGLKLLMEG